MHAIRGAALVVAVVAWWWASSVFTPWAESTDHRLWLFDGLYYLRFALLAWGVGEFGSAFVRYRARAGARHFIAPACAAVLASIAWAYEDTDAGFRFKVRASEAALVRSTTLGYDTPRHRAGHLLIDSVREPCDGEPWLWLGRPFGGGTGTGRALVRAKGDAPMHPQEGSYDFAPVTGRWWLATLTDETRPPSHRRVCAPPLAGSSIRRPR